MSTKTTDRQQGGKSSGGSDLLGELEQFMAGWTADRIRSFGERARAAREGGDDGGDSSDKRSGGGGSAEDRSDDGGGDQDGGGQNGGGGGRSGGGGGVMQGAMRAGLQELQEGGSPVGAAAKAAMSGVGSKVKQAFSGGKKGSGGSKVINIVEDMDVGVPIDVAWKEWLSFNKFSGYMKGVDSAERVEEDKVNFRAKVAWSHRSWQSTITDEVENERLGWKSEGSKGSVDGVITFHELGPNLTKMLLVLEYHPAGLFEKTGNLWRAQGRRARLDFKHFRRHVMTTFANEHDDEGEQGGEEQEQGEQGRDESSEEQGRTEQETDERGEGTSEEDAVDERDEADGEESDADESDSDASSDDSATDESDADDSDDSDESGSDESDGDESEIDASRDEDDERGEGDAETSDQEEDEDDSEESERRAG